jgi:TatA/E family protein of Tat protein translocase
MGEFFMFGISTQELLIVLVIALVIIGPKKLPELARTLGKGFSELRKAMDGVKKNVNLDSALNAMMRDDPEPKRKSTPESPSESEQAKNEHEEQELRG